MSFDRGDKASRDAFCAAGLLLGLTPAEVSAALGGGLGAVPGWVGAYAAAGSREGRAAQLAPRVLALRIEVEEARLTWG